MGDNKLLGIIAVADVIKEDSPKAIKELQNMGIRVVMLTGDNEKPQRLSVSRSVLIPLSPMCSLTARKALLKNL